MEGYGTFDYYKSPEGIAGGGNDFLNRPCWLHPLMEIIDHPWIDAFPSHPLAQENVFRITA